MSDQSSQSSRPGSPIAPLPDFSATRPYRFTWDPASRRAGPASVSGSSEGRGDYFAANAQNALNNLSSASLAAGAFPHNWSSNKHGFNAISTILNNPHKRLDPPKAHATVPPVPPSSLPRVRRKDFDSYLKSVTPEWERLEKNIELGRDGVVQPEIFGPPHSPFPTDAPSSPRTPRPTPGRALPPLESIPSVFFDPKFDLTNPHIFAAVVEQQDSEDPLDPASLSHSLPLLEKLSHHADVVEQHLIQEISRRSSSFFAALTNLRDLQTESEQCLERIAHLRRSLKDLDDNSAKRGLQVIRLQSRFKNINTVQGGVKTIGGINEALSVTKDLAAAGEWTDSLGMIEKLRGLWESQEQNLTVQLSQPSKSQLKKSSPGQRKGALETVPESPKSEEGPLSASNSAPFPLSSLQAFGSLPDHLRDLTFDIASTLSTDLVDLLKVDLIQRLDAQHSISDNDVPDVDQTFKDRLTHILNGLIRTQGLQRCIPRWRDIVLCEIRNSVKQRLPVLDDLDHEEGEVPTKSGVERGAELRHFLRAQPHAEFLSLIRDVYSTLFRGIIYLQKQNTAITEALDSMQIQNSNANSGSTELSLIDSDLSDVVFSVSELAHSRAAKIVSIRAELHASLTLEDFYELFSVTWNFVIQTETICRRMIVGLRGVIVAQAKAFLQASHSVRITQSAKFVEDEQWTPAEVAPSAQALANTIVDSAMSDPPALVLRQNADGKAGDDKDSITATNGAHTSSNATKAKHIVVEDRKYSAVPATLQTLSLLSEYLKIIINLPLLTTDAVSRVIEFLKSFNSRTCQVILGAGAMRSAGLKNITAKHLALASQSLSIVIALIPYVRECFRRHLNPKQAVMLVEFDKLKRDYQEHQNEIHAKLIAIMGDRLSAHCRTLQTVKWDDPRDTVNNYMEVLVKETITLHKVLSRYLPEAVVQYVMSQVFAAINHQVSEEYDKIELSGQEAKERMLRDARFLHEKLSTLKNVGAPTQMLVTVVQEKPIPRKTPSLPTSKSTNERIRGLFHSNTANGNANVIEAAKAPLPPVGEKEKDKGKGPLDSPLPDVPPATPAKDIPQAVATPPRVASPEPIQVSVDSTEDLPISESMTALVPEEKTNGVNHHEPSSSESEAQAEIATEIATAPVASDKVSQSAPNEVPNGEVTAAQEASTQ